MRSPLPRARLVAATGLMVLLVLAADRLSAQPAPAKKVLTLADNDIWKALPPGGPTLSRDGKYVIYTVYPIDGPGDAEVIVRHLPSGKDVRFARGGRPAAAEGAAAPPAAGPAPAGPAPQFNPNVTKAVFALTPTKAEIDKARADKLKAEDFPQPALAVVELATGQITARIPRAKGFTVGGEGAGFLVYHIQPKIEPKTDTPGGKTEPEPAPAGPMGGKGKGVFPGRGGGTGTAPAPRAVRTYGTDLVIRDLTTGSERTIPDVDEYTLAKDGKLLVFTVASRKEDTNGVFAVEPTTPAGPVAIRAGSGRYSRLTWDEKQTKLGFVLDDAGVLTGNEIPPPRPAGTPAGATATAPPPQPRLHVFVWDRGAKVNGITGAKLTLGPAGPGGELSGVVTAGVAANAQFASPAVEVAGPNTPELRAGWTVAEAAPSFNTDGSKVFLRTAPIRPPAPTAGPPAADKVDLDIWHWKDGHIQPMQLKEAGADRSKSYAAVVSLDTRQFRQLSDETITVTPPAAGDWALGADDRKYRHLTGYVMPVPEDYALVNVRTGERKPRMSGFSGRIGASADGKYLLLFDGKDWKTISVADGKTVNLTAPLPVKFFDEEDDHPDKPPPYGGASVTADGKFVLLNDRYDIWKVAVDGSSAENLTKIGRGQQTQFRLVNIRPDDEDDRKGTDLTKPLLLRAENLSTRDTGFFRLEPGGEPKLLVMGARLYGIPQKAKNADTFLLTVQTFYEYPDYYVTGPDFHELKRITDINPTIRQYNWGRSELIRYKSSDGQPLSGVLIKPENFDPSKKYPMVVYIYERLTNTTHLFHLPYVSRGQVINPTFYASNGYLVLMPDIAYKVGYPGQSAIKCILPAIQAVVDKGCVTRRPSGSTANRGAATRSRIW